MKIRSEDSIPKGYGIAYILYDKDLAVVLPIPINVIVRSILYIYYILIKAGYPSKWEKKLESVWEYGIEVGRNSRQSEIESLKMERDIYFNMMKEMNNERKVQE